MAQYYTLEEAARVLQLTPDEVKKLAEGKKVRTFRDRGTLRFRSQDIDELARSLGLGSEPDLQLGEVPPTKKPITPPPGKRSKHSNPDSSVQMVPMEDSSDSDVKVPLEPEDSAPAGSARGKSASDSDIRIEPSKSGQKRDSDDALVTEEI